MRQQKLVISIGILVFIGLHAVPILDKRVRKQIWPVLDWAMYKDAIPPGPIQTERRRIVAVTADGEREEITGDQVGLSSFALERLYLKPMKAGDSAAAQQLLAQLNRRRPAPFVELRLERDIYKATPGGLVKEGQPALSYRAASSPSR